MSSTVELTGDDTPRRREVGPDPMIGRRLMHYRVLEVVGQGGMSVVYRGRDENLDRDVAIKVLHPFLAQKEECRARLAREARAVARLEHPNILKVFDYSGDPSTMNERLSAVRDDSDKDGFLVCELVPGDTLKHFADRHNLWKVPEAGALVVLRVARALQHAHEQGVVHRDLKPENIMVRDDGVLKLMDFGIAQVVDQKQLTVTGTLLGSPAHMAPESIEGYPADARSDLFSLGTVLYWLVTGALPFEALTPHALLKNIVDAAPMPAQQRSPRVSDDLAKVIARAMARRPEQRFENAGEMAEALEAALLEAGVSSSEEAVAELLRAPDEGLPALSASVRVAFLARAERLLEEGSAARALACVGRVLAEHPQDEDAERLLERAQAGALDEEPAEEPAGEPVSAAGASDSDETLVTGVGPSDDSLSIPRARLSVGRVLLAGALLLVIAGVFVVGTLVDRALPPEPSPDDAAADSSATPSGPQMTMAAAKEHGGGESPQPKAGEGTPLVRDPPVPLRVAPRPVVARKPHPDVARVRNTSDVTRTVRVIASPYAHIHVDGVEVARNAMARDLQLTPGSHTLRFEHEHAKTKTREVVIPAEGAVPEVRVALDEAKPAYLKVSASPADAEVAVDGIPKGTAKDSASRPIVVPFRKLVARQRFEVMVWKDGYRTHIVKPQLEAGQTAELKVVLEPEHDDGVQSDDGRRRPIEVLEPDATPTP